MIRREAFRDLDTLRKLAFRITLDINLRTAGVELRRVPVHPPGQIDPNKVLAWRRLDRNLEPKLLGVSPEVNIG